MFSCRSSQCWPSQVFCSKIFNNKNMLIGESLRTLRTLQVYRGSWSCYGSPTWSQRKCISFLPYQFFFSIHVLQIASWIIHICKMLQWLLNYNLFVFHSNPKTCTKRLRLQINVIERLMWTNRMMMRYRKGEQVREERGGAREQDKRKKRKKKEWRKCQPFIYGSETRKGTTGAAKRIITQKKTRRWNDRSATNE